MTENTVEIRFGEEVRQFPDGTIYEEAVREFQPQYRYPIVLVIENGSLRELHKKVKDGAVVDMVTTADDSGHKTYKRSLNLLLFKAIKDVSGQTDIPRVVQMLSTSNGYFYQMHSDLKADQAFLDKVKARMHELVKADLPIIKNQMKLEDARKLFRERGLKDKDELFRYRLGSTVNLYCLDDYEDYFYGYMVPSTGYLKWFDLMLYDDGFLLLCPEKSDPEMVKPYKPSEKVFAVQKESELWGESLGVDTVGRLNQSICQDGIGHIMLV